MSLPIHIPTHAIGTDETKLLKTAQKEKIDLLNSHHISFGQKQKVIMARGVAHSANGKDDYTVYPVLILPKKDVASKETKIEDQVSPIEPYKN